MDHIFKRRNLSQNLNNIAANKYIIHDIHLHQNQFYLKNI